MTTERRPWPRDPRIMACADGSIIGVKGHPLTPSRNSRGYLMVGVLAGGWGHAHPVHVIACEAWHGLAPMGDYEAAHGNGDPVDNRPVNLSWKTVAENAADRIDHGTQVRGIDHGRARLTEAAVRVIRESTEPDRVLAARFGVSRRTVSFVREGKTWRHVA